MVQKKGQIQVGSHISFNGYDGQVSYTPSNKFTILANFSAFGANDEFFHTAKHTIEKHNFSEIGIGYYKNNKKGRTSDIFMLFGNGYTYKFFKGGDTVTGNVKPFEYTKTANYNRFLLQADFIKKSSRKSFAFSPRLFLVNYYNVKDNGTNIFEQNPRTYVYTEGVVTLGVKVFKDLRISSQVAFTIPIIGWSVAYYEFSPLNFSVGLTYNMNFRKNNVDK
ncbi:hypothetical protein CJD36_000035 [Flavipsychrobacter stenotrophus]|uniref:DUF5723 domain-containing protein n=2 Tax=Flavipsychrobacter stenotrophus TaxID=2077091 RepID=A0A2S7T095_9BACT|nr:hypothetical protein CJD36_000035 [Flavipsychrobacter stenotrophus]